MGCCALGSKEGVLGKHQWGQPYNAGGIGYHGGGVYGNWGHRGGGECGGECGGRGTDCGGHSGSGEVGGDCGELGDAEETDPPSF